MSLAKDFKTMNISRWNLPTVPSPEQERAVDLYYRLVGFLTEAKFVSRTHADRVMSLFFEGLSDTDIATMLGISESTCRQIRQQVFREAVKIVGDDALRLVCTADPRYLDILEERLNSSEGSTDLSEYMDPYFVAQLKAYSNTDRPAPINIREHEDEFKYFLSYSKAAIQQLSSLDPNVISYFLALLTGTGGHPDERAWLARRLQS